MVTKLGLVFFIMAAACHGDHVKSILEINKEAGLLENLIDGDIIPPNQKLHMRRTAFRGHINKWSNNILYYSFKDGYFNGKNETFVRHIINRDLKKLTSTTCVRFYEDPHAQNRVEIFDNGGCTSSYGMMGGVQPMSLAIGCIGGPALHEFLHALGFIHTQSRPDRDNYITVDNTLLNEQYKTVLEEAPIMEQLSVPYDYGSIMHYGANDFTDDKGFAILPKDGNYLYTIGSKMLSFTDILAVNKAYNCLDKCGEKVCYYGGYPNPNNCTECVCPLGFLGHDCNEWGSNAWAESNWKTFELNVNGEKHGDINFSYYRIYVPAGKTLILKIMDISDHSCTNYGCLFMGAELKIQKDPTLTGPRFCCSTAKGKEFRSTNHVVPIFVYSGWAEFKLKVAYVFVH